MKKRWARVERARAWQINVWASAADLALAAVDEGVPFLAASLRSFSFFLSCCCSLERPMPAAGDERAWGGGELWCERWQVDKSAGGAREAQGAM